MLPTFLIVGAQKAGTTSLWHYLQSHEDVFLPQIKEPGYFAREFGWGNGISWYEGLFADGGQYRARGEASTYYSMYPFFKGVPKRIADALPDVRLIYIMRDPIERMRSCYVQLLTDGQERRPMKDALFLDCGYVYLSSYALQIEQYLDYFPRDQILLLTAEDLRRRRSETLTEVLTFLGVDPTAKMDTVSELNESRGKRAPRASGRMVKKLADSERVHPGIRRRLQPLLRSSLTTRVMAERETELDDDLRARLIELVRPDVERLRQLMGPSFTGWGLLRDVPAPTRQDAHPAARLTALQGQGTDARDLEAGSRTTKRPREDSNLRRTV